MALEKYRQKRDFSTTAEPAGSISSSQQGPLEFVIQKHHASRLHYDLRLELNGVLISWAVPKGPSLNPSDKRLAIQVEDHPFEYRTFEGTIPEGQYGAGKVIVWDAGTFTIPGANTRKQVEKQLAEGLKKGHFHIIFFGHKIKGEFALVHLKNDESKNQWLFFKIKDQYSTEEDITKNNRSVLSHRIL